MEIAFFVVFLMLVGLRIWEIFKLEKTLLSLRSQMERDRSRTHSSTTNSVASLSPKEAKDGDSPSPSSPATSSFSSVDSWPVSTTTFFVNNKEVDLNTPEGQEAKKSFDDAMNKHRKNMDDFRDSMNKIRKP